MGKAKTSKKKGVKVEIINCPFCFKEIRSDLKFCTYCGSNLKESEESIEEFKGDIAGFEEETVNIENLLNKNVTINNLIISGQNPEKIKVVLEKMFRNKEDKDLILFELTRLPEGFFAKFAKSYEKLTKELEKEKSEYDLNNDNYFDEGKGK